MYYKLRNYHQSRQLRIPFSNVLTLQVNCGLNWQKAGFNEKILSMVCVTAIELMHFTKWCKQDLSSALSKFVAQVLLIARLSGVANKDMSEKISHSNFLYKLTFKTNQPIIRHPKVCKTSMSIHNLTSPQTSVSTIVFICLKYKKNYWPKF